MAKLPSIIAKLSMACCFVFLNTLQSMDNTKKETTLNDEMQFFIKQCKIHKKLRKGTAGSPKYTKEYKRSSYCYKFTTLLKWAEAWSTGTPQRNWEYLNSLRNKMGLPSLTFVYFGGAEIMLNQTKKDIQEKAQRIHNSKL